MNIFQYPLAALFTMATMTAVIAPALAACSSDEDGGYDGMFVPPPSGQITPNSVRGFWVASIQRDEEDGVDAQMDIRMRITDDALVIANRCHYRDGAVLTAGITVPVRIDEANTDLVTLGAAENAPSSGGHVCRLAIQEGALEYHLSGFQLDFQGRDLPYPKFATAKDTPPFTKASD